MGKKKRRGHYCYICGTYKANEKFSGSGHARHVCKECAALPQEKKNELQYINRIGRIADKYPRSRADWDLLEKYAKNNKFKFVSDSEEQKDKARQQILDFFEMAKRN